MLLPELVQRFMAEMQPRGVGVALDDLGAGLIAGRRREDVLFDCVRIDRTWAAGPACRPGNPVLWEAPITVAHQFEMSAAAEGVGREAKALRAPGADCRRGCLLGRPQPILRGRQRRRGFPVAGPRPSL